MTMPDSLKLLFLSQEDMIACGVLDMSRCVKTMEEAFRLHDRGETLMAPAMPHGSMICYPDQPVGSSMPSSGPDKRICSMPAYVGGHFNMSGVKWYGSNNENPKKRNLPRSIHLIVLNDPESGVPLAIMDGTLVSAMRTGAVAGVGARLFANRESEIAGIVGAGVISRAELAAFHAVLPNLRRAQVYDMSHSNAERFAEEMSAKLDIEISCAKDTKAALAGADVVGVATSGAIDPVIKPEWIKPEGFVAPLGWLGGPDSLYVETRLVVDDRSSIRAFMGDSSSPAMFSDLSRLAEGGQVDMTACAELGSVLNAQQSIEKNSGKKTMLLAYGLPIEDVAWSSVVYSEAVRNGVGQRLRLWERPHWL